MSTENNLWMGDIESWMTESFIMQSFNHYNVNPTSVKLIKNRETNTNKNYCFINFNNIKDANSTLLSLNGKQIPGTSLKFKLNWANYYSSFNKSVYVGNLNSDVDDISLYNLFKKKYNSVHHASVITDKGKSKGFGFVLFRNEEEYENCLKEMNGIEFHGNIIKVNEQKKKEENDHNKELISGRMNDNNINNIRNIFNDNMNVNNINDLLHNSRNNLYQQIYNNNMNNININSNNNYIDTSNMLINDLSNNSNNIKQNNINSIISNNISDIHNFNELNLANLNFQNNFNQIQNIGSQEIMNRNNNNFMSFYPKNLNELDINNRNLTNISMNNIRNKNNSNTDYYLEIFNKYDDVTLHKKIRENLDKTYHYYSSVYPGDKNKLKCKLLIILINIFYLVSNMFVYFCQTSNELQIFSKKDFDIYG